MPDVFLLNAAVTSAEARQFWAMPGWLPTEIGIILEGGQLFYYEGEDLRLHLQRGMHSITVYELVGVVAEVVSGEHQASHLVALVNVDHSAPESRGNAGWHLFNDFLVKKIPQEEALRFHASWKVPSVLAYQIKSGSHAVDDSWKDSLDTTILYRELSYTWAAPEYTRRDADWTQSDAQGKDVQSTVGSVGSAQGRNVGCHRRGVHRAPTRGD